MKRLKIFMILCTAWILSVISFFGCYFVIGKFWKIIHPEPFPNLVSGMPFLFLLLTSSIATGLVVPKLIFQRLILRMNLLLPRQPLRLGGRFNGLVGYLVAAWTLAYMTHTLLQLFLRFLGRESPFSNDVRLWIWVTSGCVAFFLAFVTSLRWSPDYKNA